MRIITATLHRLSSCNVQLISNKPVFGSVRIRTDLGDLSSGGRFHERAAQYLQGVGPNVISRFNNGLSVF
jgi:hypothetical protein